MRNKKDRKVKFQLLNPMHLISIDFFPEDPDKMITFHYQGVGASLEEIDPKNKQQLADHIQDLIIARQIDQKLLVMLKQELPDTLNREFIFPEAENTDLFYALSEKAKEIAKECLETDEYLNEKGFLSRAHFLAITGKYTEAKLLLSDLESIVSEMDFEINLQIKKEREFLKIRDTPFTCHESYVEEKKMYMPTMFKTVTEIPWTCRHNIADYSLQFHGHILEINFSEEENMVLKVTDEMKRAILQCNNSGTFIEIFKSAASHSNNDDYGNLVAILESYDEAASLLNLKNSRD